MLRNLAVAAATLWLCAVGNPVAAQEPAPRADIGSVGLRIGTGGLGVDFAYGINRFVDIRAGYHFGSVSMGIDLVSEEEDGTIIEEEERNFDGKVKFNSALLVVDVKPFGGGFRVSVGGYQNGPSLKFTESGPDDRELGDNVYFGDLAMAYEYDLGSTKPYVGIGWGGTTNRKGFGMSGDLGVMITGDADVTVSASGRACDNTDDSGCNPNGPEGFDVNEPGAAADAFRSNLLREASAHQDDIKFWPVIGLGLHYRF